MRKIRKNSNEWKTILSSTDGWFSNKIGALNKRYLGDLMSRNILTLTEENGSYIARSTGEFTYKKAVNSTGEINELSSNGMQPKIVKVVAEDGSDTAFGDLKLSNMDSKIKHVIDKLKQQPKVFSDDLTRIAESIYELRYLGGAPEIICSLIGENDPSILRIFDGYNENQINALHGAFRDIEKRNVLIENLNKTYDVAIARKQFSFDELNHLMGGKFEPNMEEIYQNLVVLAESTNNGLEPSKYVEFNKITNRNNGDVVGYKTSFYFGKELTAVWYSTSPFENGTQPNDVNRFKTLSELFDKFKSMEYAQKSSAIDERTGNTTAIQPSVEVSDKIFNEDGAEFSTSGNLIVEAGNLGKLSIKDDTFNLTMTGEKYVGTCYVNPIKNTRTYEDKNGNSFDSLDEMESHFLNVVEKTNIVETSTSGEYVVVSDEETMIDGILTQKIKMVSDSNNWDFGFRKMDMDDNKTYTNTKGVVCQTLDVFESFTNGETTRNGDTIIESYNELVAIEPIINDVCNIFIEVDEPILVGFRKTFDAFNEKQYFITQSGHEFVDVALSTLEDFYCIYFDLNDVDTEYLKKTLLEKIKENSSDMLEELESPLNSGVDTDIQPSVEITLNEKVTYYENDNNTYIPTNEKIVVEDYPYGYNLRTKLFHTLEFNNKGYRVVSQTINPKTGRLNAPKKSTYHDFIARYYNEDGHVKCKHFEINGTESINKISEFIGKNFGIYTAEEIKKIYTTLLSMTKIDIRANVSYSGSTLEDLKPLYDLSVQACVTGINSNGNENVFVDIYLDAKAIDATKPSGFNAFKIS
jgi:hypothetical protein